MVRIIPAKTTTKMIPPSKLVFIQTSNSKYNASCEAGRMIISFLRMKINNGILIKRKKCCGKREKEETAGQSSGIKYAGPPTEAVRTSELRADCATFRLCLPLQLLP